MAVLYVSEAEALRDFPSLLAQARAGTEIVIESEGAAAVVVTPSKVEPGVFEPGTDPGYDDWLRSEVEATLRNGPSTRLTEEQAEALFEERRRSMLTGSHA